MKLGIPVFTVIESFTEYSRKSNDISENVNNTVEMNFTIKNGNYPFDHYCT